MSSLSQALKKNALQNAARQQRAQRESTEVDTDTAPEFRLRVILSEPKEPVRGLMAVAKKPKVVEEYSPETVRRMKHEAKKAQIRERRE